MGCTPKNPHAVGHDRQIAEANDTMTKQPNNQIVTNKKNNYGNKK
ncbi:MAG: hypothetical protein U0L53_05880 [Bacteroidales bacterium]|nr:hypothetical protein [Bacteroidales bacterium]